MKKIAIRNENWKKRIQTIIFIYMNYFLAFDLQFWINLMAWNYIVIHILHYIKPHATFT